MSTKINFGTNGTNASFTTFDNFITTIANSLGIADASSIRSIMTQFDDNTQYRLMDDSNIGTLLAAVTSASANLNDLITKGALLPSASSIAPQWKAMTDNLAELELLSVLQGVNTRSDLIQGLMDALNTKLVAVNNILKANIKSQKGGDVDYSQKYLKYKNKYLSLANKI